MRDDLQIRELVIYEPSYVRGSRLACLIVAISWDNAHIFFFFHTASTVRRAVWRPYYVIINFDWFSAAIRYSAKISRRGDDAPPIHLSTLINQFARRNIFFRLSRAKIFIAPFFFMFIVSIRFLGRARFLRGEIVTSVDSIRDRTTYFRIIPCQDAMIARNSARDGGNRAWKWPMIPSLKEAEYRR